MARQYPNAAGNRKPPEVRENPSFLNQFSKNIGVSYRDAPIIGRGPLGYLGGKIAGDERFVGNRRLPAPPAGVPSGEYQSNWATYGLPGNRKFNEQYPAGVQPADPIVRPSPMPMVDRNPNQPVVPQQLPANPAQSAGMGRNAMQGMSFMNPPVRPQASMGFPVNPGIPSIPASRAPAPSPVLPGANPAVGYVPNASRTALQFEAAQRQAIERNPTPQQRAESMQGLRTSQTPIDEYTGFDVLTGKGDMQGSPNLAVPWEATRGLSENRQEILRSQGRINYGSTVPQLPRAPVVPLDRQPGADAALADLRAANAPGEPLVADSPVEQERIAQAATRRQAADRFAQSTEGQRLQQNRDNARMQRMSPEARQNEMQQRGEQNRATAFRERTAAAERAAAPANDLVKAQTQKTLAEAEAALRAPNAGPNYRLRAMTDLATGYLGQGLDVPKELAENINAELGIQKANPNAPVSMTGQAPAQGAVPTPGAIHRLRKDPSLADQFDAKYGPGSAARSLKQ